MPWSDPLPNLGTDVHWWGKKACGNHILEEGGSIFGDSQRQRTGPLFTGKFPNITRALVVGCVNICQWKLFKNKKKLSRRDDWISVQFVLFFSPFHDIAGWLLFLRLGRSWISWSGTVQTSSRRSGPITIPPLSPSTSPSTAKGLITRWALDRKYLTQSLLVGTEEHNRSRDREEMYILKPQCLIQ